VRDEQSKYRLIPAHPERETVCSERGAVEESKGDKLPSTSSGQTDIPAHPERETVCSERGAVEESKYKFIPAHPERIRSP